MITRPLLLSLPLAALLTLFILAGCETPPGVYPNCRKNPNGDHALDETGWYCTGSVMGTCGGDPDKEVDGPVCGVGLQGAIISFRRIHPGQVVDPECKPLPLSPSGPPNATKPPSEEQAWGDPKCDTCVAAQCAAERAACDADPLCRDCDTCERAHPNDATACPCGGGDAQTTGLGTCVNTYCAKACYPSAGPCAPSP